MVRFPLCDACRDSAIASVSTTLFGLASARNPRIEGLIAERNTLLDKRKRTPKEEKRLRELEHELDNMPIAERREDQEAMDFIRQAAALLKGKELRKQ